MAKRVKFTATFADGAVFTRTSDRKEYTHAWRMIARRGPVPADWSDKDRAQARPAGELVSSDGFATSQALAERAVNSAFSGLMSTRGNWGRYLRSLGSLRQYEAVSLEVVAVVRED